MNRRLFASVAVLGLCLSCEVGPQGQIGPAGPAGSSPGSSPDCPDGYTRDNTAMNIILCKQGADEVVKVGTKGSAFWIDRYEASVWQNADGTGMQFGINTDNYPSAFPKNGQATVPLYAISRIGVHPSESLTWFQANEACRASGKRLPTRDEWISAARGTLDPGSNAGTNGACVTVSPGPTGLRNTGLGTKCVSDWGAQDMIGNLWEFTNEWVVAAGVDGAGATPWPDLSYGSDLTANIASKGKYQGNFIAGLPGAALRGGSRVTGTGAGIYTLDVTISVADWSDQFGFRCVVPR